MKSWSRTILEWVHLQPGTTVRAAFIEDWSTHSDQSGLRIQPHCGIDSCGKKAVTVEVAEHTSATVFEKIFLSDARRQNAFDLNCRTFSSTSKKHMDSFVLMAFMVTCICFSSQSTFPSHPKFHFPSVIFSDDVLCEYDGGSLCQLDTRSLLWRWKAPGACCFFCPSLVWFSSALSRSTSLLVLSRARARLSAQKHAAADTHRRFVYSYLLLFASLFLPLLPFPAHSVGSVGLRRIAGFERAS